MSNSTQLLITEIYSSIQGESLYTGHPCAFIRLSGCPLNCKWCDTVYSFKDGNPYTIEEIINEVAKYKLDIVEVTGGEPLANPNSIHLMQSLIDEGYQVLLETSGHLPIKNVPEEVHVIMDIKCPASGMASKNYWENIKKLKPSDEVKFVVASKQDFNWAKQIIDDHSLQSKAQLCFSPAWGHVDPKDLVGWLLDEQPNLKARLNLQIHKYIWSPKAKGV